MPSDYRHLLEELRKGFLENFPEQDYKKLVSIYCSKLLSSRIDDFIKKYFDGKTSLEIFNILRCMDNEQENTSQKRPGRPRKPRAKKS